ncbi:hypothetical protein GCM10008915_39100 [Bifidobacterium pullorum subsp. gallinarum]
MDNVRVGLYFRTCVKGGDYDEEGYRTCGKHYSFSRRSGVDHPGEQTRGTG